MILPAKRFRMILKLADRLLELYVTNLFFDTNETQLRDVFSAHGSIKRVNLPERKRGIAFIRYDTEEEARQSLELNGKIFRGRLLSVALADPNMRKSKHKSDLYDDCVNTASGQGKASIKGERT